METADPLIVTARLDAESFARLDALRRAHFPAALNRLAAHLTLFHHLPSEALAEVTTACAAAWPDAPLPLAFPALRLLGRGVAYTVEAPALEAVRATLAARFRGRLTPQDAQAWRPHVTIQNKADPAAARALKARLEAEGGVAFTGRCDGLSVWRYLGGSWGLEAQVGRTNGEKA